MGDKVLVTIFVGFILMIGFVLYIGFVFTQKVESKRDLCAEAGGVSLVGDKGHYKFCLRPEALIELPKE